MLPIHKFFKISHPTPRIQKRVLGIALTALLLLFAGCTTAATSAEDQFQIRDAILLWHNLPEAEATAFANVIDRYRRANPGIDVVVQPQGAAMEEEFVRATRSGLGPDLLVTSSANVATLANANALAPIDGQVSAEQRERYLTVALQTLFYNDVLYGLPVAIDTLVLYYHRALIERPPTTVDQLFQAASGSQRVLMNSQFSDAIWSARAFGVDLFDSAGDPQDATAGIANWLTWMEQVRDTPGFITDDNTEALRNRFLEGDIPYYIGHAHELNLLSAAFGADLGVAQLPAGPAGSAGPLLTTTALLFNAMSSSNQLTLSLDLARFITSSDQQSAMMREANVVPANVRTRISEGLYPEVATVEAQARTAIPWYNDSDIQAVYTVLANAYNQTMAGVMSATEAAASVQATLVAEHGFPGAPMVALCLVSGELTILTSDAGNYATILNTLIDAFSEVCPNIRVTVNRVAQDEIGNRAADRGQDAELFFFPHSELHDLMDAGVVRPLTDLVDPTLVQQMRPVAVEAVRVDGELYGVPIFIDLQTLFHNKARVPDPAGTLADLRAQAQAGVPIVLDGDFEWAFWGIGAFGGRLYGDNGQFALEPQTLIDWLTWLQTSQKDFGIRINTARDIMLADFAAGATAYFVTPSEQENELLLNIPRADLSAALMPEGPAGPGRPFVWTDGLMINAAISDAQLDLAARFLNFAAGIDGQTELLNQHLLLPANSAVLIDRYPNVVRMAEQLQSAQLLQVRPWLPMVLRLGDAAYRQVLVDGVAPAEAVTTMYAALAADAAQYGIAVPTLPPTVSPLETPPIELSPTSPADATAAPPATE
jgi:maltose-binding protein MalE